MKQSSKCAIGGIVSALSLVLMISVAVIPFLTYALPAVAGMLIIFIVCEIDKKWAFGVYCTVAILGMLLVPDKEVAVMYLAFFGYYPILKAMIESKFPLVIEWIIKIVAFAATMAGSYFLMIKFMGVTIDETEEWGMMAYPILLGMGTFAFILYDIALTKMITLYIKKWQKHFKRYFK
ncbi:MAG: hypothetical protein E7547_08980 [Ruminococcaceae bacterium]|nr:hypothetical protein [Oscillospiraceae bacterium]